MLLPDLHTDFSRGRSGYFFNDIQLNAILVGFNFVSYYLSSLCSYNSITYIFMVYFMYIHMWKVKVLVAQLCPTLCYPMDCSLPGSSVHWISQARILEWVASPSPGDLPDPVIEPRFPALQTDSLPSEPPGKPIFICMLDKWYHTIHIIVQFTLLFQHISVYFWWRISSFMGLPRWC